MEGKQFLELIHEYIVLGWHPFPISVYWENGKREKVPTYEWKMFQERPPNESEIGKWLKDKYLPFYGLAIATTDVLVLDFDRKGSQPDLSQWQDVLFDGLPMWTKTASGGFHFFFANPTGLRNATNIFDGNKDKGDTMVDVRGEGGLVVVGPTCLFSSDPRKAQTPKELSEISPVGRYETLNWKSPSELPLLPPQFLSILSGKTPKYHAIEKPKVSEGERNDTATSLAYKFLLSVKTRAHYKNAEASYWRLIGEKFADWEKDKTEYESCWKSAHKKMLGLNGPGWPFPDANEIIARTKREVMDETIYEEDMRSWNLQIEETLRIGDLVKFTMKNGRRFIVEVNNLYSQLKFRTSYTAGTNLILPKISNKTFDKFLLSFTLKDIAETGASISDILKELLAGQYARLPFSESEAEAVETVQSSFWSKCGRKVFFTLQGLSLTQSWLLHRTTPSVILLSLKEIGAYQVNNKGLLYWVYEINDVGGDDTSEAVPT